MEQQAITQTSKDFNIQLTKEIYSLKKFALKFTLDSQDINDLVQDTLLKAMRFYHQFKNGTSLKAWLFVIMRTTYINNYRKAVIKRTVFMQIHSYKTSKGNEK